MMNKIKNLYTTLTKLCKNLYRATVVAGVAITLYAGVGASRLEAEALKYIPVGKFRQEAQKYQDLKNQRTFNLAQEILNTYIESYKLIGLDKEKKQIVFSSENEEIKQEYVPLNNTEYSGLLAWFDAQQSATNPSPNSNPNPQGGASIVNINSGSNPGSPKNPNKFFARVKDFAKEQPYLFDTIFGYILSETFYKNKDRNHSEYIMPSAATAETIRRVITGELPQWSLIPGFFVPNKLWKDEPKSVKKIEEIIPEDIIPNTDQEWQDLLPDPDLPGQNTTF